tara:strand:- start:246 stop:572 length:327 start_codon:yes stop_codon:yes gene_type:complete
MLLWITKQIIISLLIIVLAHSIYMFLKTNLTTPKIRDLVNKPQKQYEKIYEKTETKKINNSNQEEEINMKNELQNYLKELSDTTKRKNVISGDFNSNFSPQFQNIQSM